MALEDELKALTAAVNRNSDLLEGLTAKANAAKSAPAADSEKATDAPKRGRPAKEAAEPPKKAKVPTPEEMATATKNFLEVDDEDEYAARRALVKRIIAKHDVAKMSEIAADQRHGALDALTAYKAGEATAYDEKEEEDDIA
jgi:hypothetical protein